MGKTNRLIEYLKELLSQTSSIEVYHEQAIRPSYPYLVFDFDSFGYSNILEINLWDKGSAVRIEDIADILEKELDKSTDINDDMRIILHFKNRNNVSDPQDNLKRRRLTFYMAYYNLKGE
ncbi:hypothetical protein [Abyssisolibacter fermentans]|uniref:hypothetical protein n=1 Tax=Abyssisolibacter fermentans TaxID=1766203 RepID=UPI0008302373|nr:hypothetical protein [Abyssisolibacter fermentans]